MVSDFNCTESTIVWMCHWMVWIQNTFHTSAKMTGIIGCGSIIFAVLFLLFLCWLWKSAYTLWAINVFWVHAGKAKMSHNISNYLALSILKTQIKDVIRDES